MDSLLAFAVAETQAAAALGDGSSQPTQPDMLMAQVACSGPPALHLAEVRSSSLHLGKGSTCFDSVFGFSRYGQWHWWHRRSSEPQELLSLRNFCL